MQFAIPVKIVNLATNSTIFASNHSVLIGGAPAMYNDNSVVCYLFDDSITSVILTNPFLQWNRWQVNTDAWIFENRANEEMLQVRPDNLCPVIHDHLWMDESLMAGLFWFKRLGPIGDGERFGRHLCCELHGLALSP
jgi:hypothetical protein